MTDLKFADTHNLVAFLSKPTESEGFEQIVDFLNANPIRYALTINPTIYISCIKQFWSTVNAKIVNGEVQLQALVDGKKIIITESTMRRDLQLEDAKGVDCLPNSTIFEQLTLMGSKTTAWNEFSSTMASAIICLATNQTFNFSKYIFENNVADEAINEEMDESLERAATTATSLDAEQDRGGGPWCQETIGDTIAQTRFENVSKSSNDPLLARGNTLRSGDDSLKLNELMELCTNLQQRVLDLETTKTTQANEIASLKRRVKKLERRNKSRTHRLKRMYRVGSSRMVESSKDEGLGEEDASKQGRITDIDVNKDIYLVNVHTDEDMFGVNDLDGDEVFVDNVDVVKTTKETRSVVEEVTAVIEKAKLVSAIEETVNAAATTVSTTSTIPVSAATTTTTTTATITDVEITLAQALAELKSAKPKAVKDKGKGIMIEELMVEQVKPIKRLKQIRLAEELPFKLQAEKEEERFAREKAHQTEEANIAWDDVQAKIEADYQIDFKKAEAEIAQESSSKRAGDELEQENAKKQKVDEDKETMELQSLMEVILDEEEVAINVVPLATKTPTIGRIVRIKRLLDDLRVTAAKVCITDAKLMLLVYKLLLLVLKVKAASIKVTTAQILRLLKEFLLSEKG
ncbi:hypothetical protein Tco_0705488 [Tanacetum coccineum]|uniref:Xylulose kinase-1 n=1 Tax=Tanacetum coccineum TaxID=301880 RepID=A0ABQ4Y5L3_9ASTR